MPQSSGQAEEFHTWSQVQWKTEKAYVILCAAASVFKALLWTRLVTANGLERRKARGEGGERTKRKTIHRRINRRNIQINKYKLMLTEKKKVGINKNLGSLNRWSTKLNSVYNVIWNEVQTKEFRIYFFSVLFFLDSLIFPLYNLAQWDLLISTEVFHILNLEMYVLWRIFSKYCKIGRPSILGFRR